MSKFLVDITEWESAGPEDVEELRSAIDDSIASHVEVEPVETFPMEEPQYLAAEVEYAVALMKEAYPYLKDMVGVASAMRILVPDVEEFLSHHGGTDDTITPDA